MSLLTESFVDCKMLHKVSQSDGYGGETISWVEGADFRAAITFDTSLQARVAEQQGVRNLYTVTTTKDKVLEYHEVFKRLTDTKGFRVTSDGDDKATPKSATLNMRQVSAEEWSLPNA